MSESVQTRARLFVCDCYDKNKGTRRVEDNQKKKLKKERQEPQTNRQLSTELGMKLVVAKDKWRKSNRAHQK